MNIQQTNSQQFKFRKPLYGAFVIFGFIAFIPLLGAFLAGDGFRLKCQREKLYEDKCEIAVETFFQQEKFSFELSALTVKVQRSGERDGETGQYCYLPTIVVRQDGSFRAIPMVPDDCSEFEANRVVSEINYFISTPTEERLNIHRGNWKNVLLNSSPFLLVGLLFSAVWSHDSFSSCIFDIDRNCFIITRRRWFRITNIEEYSLDEIASIDLETFDNGTSIDDRVVVTLRSAKRVELPCSNCSNQKLVSDLRRFLKFG
jgi:hypothetical protein